MGDARPAEQTLEYPALDPRRPARIPAASVGRYVWGDAEAGRTSDWIYVSTEAVSQVIFGIAPGSGYRHSDAHRPVYPSDEIWYVLEGVLALADPLRGEVQRVLPGEAALFHRDTWHYAFNWSAGPLRILEFSAPPAIEAVRYSWRHEPPAELRLASSAWESAPWPPPDGGRPHGEPSFRVLRPHDRLWGLSGQLDLVLVGLLARTDALTVGELHVRPGAGGEVELHAAYETGLVLSGRLQVELPDAGTWLEVAPEDGWYLPPATPHRYQCLTGEPVVALFQHVPEARCGSS